jgi:polyhydroxybutyrate depolymerase
MESSAPHDGVGTRVPIRSRHTTTCKGRASVTNPKTQLARILISVALCSSLLACADEVVSNDEDDAGDSSSAVSCPSDPIEAGDTTFMVESGGMQRSYRLHVPEGLDREMPAPLVLNYHGLTSNAAQQIAFSGLDAVADREGFIVAYPEGISRSFNAGACCSQLASPPHEENDAQFARDLVADVSQKLCVDARRVYSTGMSNGGYMSEYNACLNADLFAAVAPVSALAFKQSTCEPSRPIPMIAFNGTEDALVNYGNASSTIQDWLGRNGCEGEPERMAYGDSYCDHWSECDGGVEMTHCTLTGMGHCWPGTTFCPFGATNTEVNANEELWRFMSRFTLPR